MKTFLLTALSLLLLTATGCSADKVLSGRVTLAGSAPHSYVRILSAQTEYRLVGPQEQQLREQWQGREVRVDGRVVKEAIGPGFPAEFEVKHIEEIVPPR